MPVNYKRTPDDRMPLRLLEYRLRALRALRACATLLCCVRRCVPLSNAIWRLDE